MYEGPPGMDVEASTFHCPTCGADILSTNQLTHEAICARLQRQNNQRPAAAQPIIRQSSSGAIADSIDQMSRQKSIKREERRIAENKLVTCPNCEKSFREQDLENHLDQECLNKELIPCEFCDQGIPMSDYNQHVDSCPSRSASQQNNRDRSPGRSMADSRRQEQSPEPVERNPPQEEAHNERPRSPERGSSQQSGGIRGFLRNLASSAANQLRSLNTEPAQQTHTASLLSQLFGNNQDPQLEQRSRNPFMEQPSRLPIRQQPNPFMLGPSQRGLGPLEEPRGRVVRTIHRGPGNSLIIRTSVVPSNEMPGPQGPLGQPMGLDNLGPFGLLLSMMSGDLPGMQPGGLVGLGNQAREETGLSKEDIDSLALVKYSKEKNKNVDPESRNCPICLDEFEDGQEVRFLWCMHRFHRTCVDTWLEKHTNCPICKKDFSEAQNSYSG